jgi:predicted RNA-binding Zn-ribbon protein involved in translation (DUF1610 family)
MPETVCYHMEEFRCPECNKILLILNTPGAYRGEQWLIRGEIQATCICPGHGIVKVPSCAVQMMRYLCPEGTNINFLEG